MKVLIVESDEALGGSWARHLERQGCQVRLVTDQEGAVDVLCHDDVKVIVMNLVLQHGSALAVADFASYKRPDARVILVTDTTYFSDGSIFSIVSNAAAYLRVETPLDDLAAMVDYHGGRLQPEAAEARRSARH